MERKVVKMTEAKKLAVFTEPLPEPGPHEMVIRITISGICHSEMPTYLGEGSMEMKGPLGFSRIVDYVPYPASFGHEPTGVVEKIGTEVTRFKVGDRVSGAGGGAFASHIVSSEYAPLVKLPESISEYDCLAEPVMCCCNIVQAVEKNMKEDGFIAVVGCGYMGQVCLSLLHAHGVKNIVAFDPRADRREKAMELGASYVFNPSEEEAVKKAIDLTGGVGFDRAIELAKDLSGLAVAVSLMKMPTADDRGIIAASSVYDKHEMWPTSLGFDLMCRCPELHFVHPGFIPDIHGLMEEAVEAYEKGYLPKDGFITHRFTPEEMCEAYELMEKEEAGYLKGVVVFN
ncbi:MAG: alcohol dehydrogenase catalytic domain-containing protein [Lachnospiraceae bacterium]|nr:alcohol dehydrogenase catalytic domain-containing protein [Lachnospiraceae bacterium]